MIYIFTLFIFIMLVDTSGIEQTHRIYCPNNCGRSYMGHHRRTNLSRHLRLECGVEPQFYCSYCQKRFRRKSNLKTHVGIVHKSFF